MSLHNEQCCSCSDRKNFVHVKKASSFSVPGGGRESFWKIHRNSEWICVQWTELGEIEQKTGRNFLGFSLDFKRLFSNSLIWLPHKTKFFLLHQLSLNWMGVCADRLWPGSSGTTTHDIFHFHWKEKHWNPKSAIPFLRFYIQILHWFFSVPKPIHPSSRENSKAQISIANNEKSLFQASNKRNGGTRAVFEIEMCLCAQCFTLLTLFTEIFYLICKCSFRNVSVELKKTNFPPITNSHWKKNTFYFFCHSGGNRINSIHNPHTHTYIHCCHHLSTEVR